MRTIILFIVCSDPADSGSDCAFLDGRRTGSNIEVSFKVAYPFGMGKTFTIGELAHAAEVPASTLRYYERIGLLCPEGRSPGNYRLYGKESLKRLRFIRAAQATGFQLEDVTTLFELQDGSAEPCKEVETLIEERLAGLEEQMKHLRQVKKVLSASLRLCRKTEGRGRCEVIERLRGGKGNRKR